MKLIQTTSRSATFAMDSDYPYYYEREFDVYVNNQFYKKEKRNIFTVFDLCPDTAYEIQVLNQRVSLQTPQEAVCLHVRDFNAVGDGIRDDTVKIQTAILCAPKNGTVYVDKGTYLVSSLFLKSDMLLYLDKEAKIIAKTDRMDFPVFPGTAGSYNFGVWEGAEVNNFASIINGVGIENAVICGQGEIDGRAELSDWYINHRQMNIAWRGHALFFNRCRNISVIGPFIHNTQAWAVHPYFSDNVSFINLHIQNNPQMPTTDGIDPDCCTDVNILGCVFDVGDDCIAIKSGTLELAKKYGKSCSHLRISNNLMKQGHGGVVFGSESSGGITDVIVEKCLFENTDRGLRIKTRRGRGNIGSIDRVSFENIKMVKVKTPFVINMYYNMGPKGGHEEYVWTTKRQPVDERTPVIGHFKFRNMECLDVGYAAGVFLGLPESKIQGIEFENITFTYDADCEEGYPVMIEHNFKMKNAGLYCLNVEDIIVNQVSFIGNLGETIIKERSEDESC